MRNVPKKNSTQTDLEDTMTEAADESSPTDKAPMKGGTAGVIQEAATLIGGPKVNEASARGSREDTVKQKTYKVLQEREIVANGFKVKMRLGKVVTEGSYNIDELKSQGLALEEVV